MKKETVHIISHSHWDREWYLPFEEHRMRLVELIDTLLELFESDSEFKSFHLDGQLIILEDYLKIRPQNREKLRRYIREGRLVVGPFYILQDDYLITSEANVRNTLIGHLEGKKWGKTPRIGYFPDTFGNAGQIPQLLRQANIDVALFGRGVKPIGFDNRVIGDHHFQSTFSEMRWQGADGSEVLGILFANWYSNGNEIPTDLDRAREFWEKKLTEVRRYAATSHYLLMNGCDHQPVQKDLSTAIQIARDLYPDIQFIHSNFEDYIKAIQSDLSTNLSCVKGELTSQETDGWYTLTNTASSRIYLKQANDAASTLLEKVVEPLIVLTGDITPRDELRYAWKLLLQNAPHDSICGCSIDAVHQEMEQRFKKVEQIGNFLCQRSLERWKEKIDTSALEGTLFSVLNTSSEIKTQLVELDLVYQHVDFRDGQLASHHQEMAMIELPSLAIYTSEGELVEGSVEDLGVVFDYELPKDAFRAAYFTRKIRVKFVAQQLPAFSWKTYQVKARAAIVSFPHLEGIENEFLKISLNENGQLEWLDKDSQKKYVNFIQFEDTGDVGNEYVFKSPEADCPIEADLLSLEIEYQTSSVVIAKAIHRMQLPVEMEASLKEEQEQLIEFKDRQSRRSDVREELRIETFITVYKGNPQVEFISYFKNQMKDHRIRVLFDMGIESSSHVADSIYEIVTRGNIPHENWENPSYPQRHRTFVRLSDDQRSMTVSSRGLHEYEIVENQKIALTILRSVGEMGDWGYFPTPDAQCIRDCQAHFALELHDKNQDFQAIHRAHAFQSDLLATQVWQKKGLLPCDNEALRHPILEKEECRIMALKRAEETDHVLFRYYNMSEETIITGHQAYGTNLLEEPIGVLGNEIKGQEIRTEILSEGIRS